MIDDDINERTTLLLLKIKKNLKYFLEKRNKKKVIKVFNFLKKIISELQVVLNFLLMGGLNKEQKETGHQVHIVYL